MSVLSFNQVKTNNDTIRIDSQYFKKVYLQEDLVRNKFENTNLGDIAFITDGQHGYHEVDENSDIRHLTAKNAKDWFANDIGADRLAKWVDEKNKRSSLKLNDLILSTRGTVGFCAIIGNNVLPANIDQDVALIEIEKPLLHPTVVLTYLNTKYGQDWIKRNITGMVQQGLALWRVRELPLPIFGKEFQKYIEEVIQLSWQKRKKSTGAFKRSNDNLSNYLGIENPNDNRNKNIKNFSDSFLKDGRLDSEYYLPKYDRLNLLVNNYKNGSVNIDQICTVKEKKFYPADKEFYKYIELANIGSAGEITGHTEELGKNLPTRARQEVETGDVIISSIEGSLESCAIIPEEYDEALCSTGFYVLSSAYINPETLLVLFKSKLMQELLARSCTGTILTSINKSDFGDIEMPIIEKNIQKRIKKRVIKSFNLRDQSKELLEAAKRAVEIAIEEDEETAINYLEGKVEPALEVENHLITY